MDSEFESPTQQSSVHKNRYDDQVTSPSEASSGGPGPLSFGGASEVQETPKFAGKSTDGAQVESRRTASGPPTVFELLTWVNPTTSAVIFTLGIMIFALMGYIAYGKHNITLASALAYTLLADLFFNFVRTTLSKTLAAQAVYVNSTWSKAMVVYVETLVNGYGRLHDSFLSGKDPLVTLQVAVGLWAFSLVGSYISFITLLVVTYVLAFTIPYAYTTNKEKVHRAYQQVSLKLKEHLDKLKLPRPARMLVCGALPLLILFYTVNWVNFLIAVFVFLVFVRLNLNEGEIKSIQNAADPHMLTVTKTAKKVADQAYDLLLSAQKPRKLHHG